MRLVFCLFFFSSRRRHTRCLSDWSSDVCSSDLPPERRRPGCRKRAPPSPPASRFRRRGSEPRGSAPPKGGAACGRNRPRSEEHTSELQSLRHLVCRLLLEKKKKTGETWGTRRRI